MEFNEIGVGIMQPGSPDASMQRPNEIGVGIIQPGSPDASMQRPSPVGEPVMEDFNAGHAMSPRDPDNPHNWPLHRKVYVCAAAYSFGFAVAFGVTAYTAGITGVMQEFDVSMTVAILGFSLNLLGIVFAPIITPHLSERLGRATVYLISLPLFSLFILGASRSQNFASLAICRFLAGFFGGPCLVLIEGTFADCWRGHTTVTYYSILSLSSYIGAACGPLVCGFVFASTNWRWTQYVTLMVALAAYLLGVGMPETYNRSLLRRRAARLGHAPPKLLSAQSGVTLNDMTRVTFFTPLKMLFTEPIVALLSIYLAFNFAVLFQWFIAVPAVLHLVYNFTIQQAGLAFIAAILGAVLAAVTSILLDKLTYSRMAKKDHDGMIPIEYRLFPAMIGGFAMTASLFWIGWTAKPEISFASPIVGTVFYVWGSMMTLISSISYLFDAYPARGTLSALTVAASLRLLCAAALPLVIIQMITNITGGWAYSVFGFISIPMLAVPFFLFKFGHRLRTKSKHAAHVDMKTQLMKDQAPTETHMMGGMQSMA